jgi:hypothetical protein
LAPRDVTVLLSTHCAGGASVRTNGRGLGIGVRGAAVRFRRRRPPLPASEHLVASLCGRPSARSDKCRTPGHRPVGAVRFWAIGKTWRCCPGSAGHSDKSPGRRRGRAGGGSSGALRRLAVRASRAFGQIIVAPTPAVECTLFVPEARALRRGWRIRVRDRIIEAVSGFALLQRSERPQHQGGADQANPGQRPGWARSANAGTPAPGGAGVLVWRHTRGTA